MRLLGAIALAGLTLTAVGCTPTCKESCRKLLSCDLDTSRLALDACVDDCERQLALYEVWQDTDKQRAFREHRSCIRSSSCDEIESGVCYDEDLFIF